MLNNLKKDNSLLTNKLKTIKESITYNVNNDIKNSINNNNDNISLTQCLKQINEDLYYKKELIRSIKNKIEKQNNELHLLEQQISNHENAHQKCSNNESGDVVEICNENNNNVNIKNDLNIQKEQIDCLNIINQQNEKIKLLQTEIEEIEKKLKELKNENDKSESNNEHNITVTKSSQSHKQNESLLNIKNTKANDYPAFLENFDENSIHEKNNPHINGNIKLFQQENKALKSIESKNKRRPFNNFNFITSSTNFNS